MRQCLFEVGGYATVAQANGQEGLPISAVGEGASEPPRKVSSDFKNKNYRELCFHLKLDGMKRDLENCRDFDVTCVFQEVDELGIGYLDERNLKLFLRKMGHFVKTEELVAILRRLDLDGDTRITF